MSDSAESSPSAVDVNFRVSDVEFLQQQARIWLEAVLMERFDEGTSLTDLLADGEILQRVSYIIHALLRKHSNGEPTSPRSLFPDPSFYGKHSGKYLPYSNVDTFLKVCQKLGLTGVDLFSPADVVEKKDIRRVCLCIRALSKKARARQLAVPNFDHVTHGVSMPTEVVDGLKESLAHASSANSIPLSLQLVETPEKVRSSPFLKKSNHPDESEGENMFTPSDFSKETVEESASSSSDKNESAGDTSTNASSGSLEDFENVNDINFNHHRVDWDAYEPRKRTLSGDGLCCVDYDDMTSNNSPIINSDSKHVYHRWGVNQFVPDSGLKDKPESNTIEVLAGERLCGQVKKDALDSEKAKKKRCWVPVLAAAIAMLGAVYVIRCREPETYEVRKGDTLSDISRRTGKANWEELARLNPGITNPDLIYPSERLRLRS